MEFRMVPQKLQSSVQRARNFYKKIDALPQYEHCKDVLDKARRHNIIEGSIIKNHGKDPDRAWKNSRLAVTALYHILDYKKMDPSRMVLPDELMDEETRREIETFGKLTELERKGASLSEYVPLLNNGNAPLAILVKLADYAVTHNGDTHLESFISKEDHPLFRMYTSKAEAERLLKMDARAGELIYAPVAELFGHPGLAGSILKHAFSVNHSDIYEAVMEKVKNVEVEERLELTRTIVRELAKRIKYTLKGAGFNDVEVFRRFEKHEGKIMRKVRRKLAEKYSETEESHMMSLEKYISENIEGFDIASLNDLVALRVVVNRLGKKEIDKMEENEKQAALRIARSLITANLDALESISGNKYSYEIEDWDKKSGYRATHFDSYPVGESRTLRFETQLRTLRDHWIAEEGGAAHWIYIGGDSEFGRILKEVYHNIIHKHNSKERKENDSQLELPINREK